MSEFICKDCDHFIDITINGIKQMGTVTSITGTDGKTLWTKKDGFKGE